MIKLILDSHIYLNFFEISETDLEKLQAVITLMNERKLEIILPEQIKNEFTRNRELKIKEGLKKIKEANIDFIVPRLAEGYEESVELTKLRKDFMRIKDQLYERINNDISLNELKADALISQIFTQAKYIELDEDIRERAKKRFHLGNPPRKNKDNNFSYGDAIIWESILKIGNNNKDTDLHFVSSDGDFASPLDENKLNRFLMNEWEDIHDEPNADGSIYFYRTLKSFFTKHFPGVEVFDVEFFKDDCIKELKKSGSFVESRELLRKLSTYGGLSEAQLKDFIEACLINNQIYRANDYTPRIWETIKTILGPHSSKLEEAVKLSLLVRYDKEKYEKLQKQKESQI